jgi:hypothetical protein
MELDVLVKIMSRCDGSVKDRPQPRHQDATAADAGGRKCFVFNERLVVTRVRWG